LARSDSHLLTFAQQMRTERNDTIARREVADDESRFIAETGELYSAPADARRFPFDQPHAGAGPRIEDRTERYPKCAGG
jgi:hypothetical protein